MINDYVDYADLMIILIMQTQYIYMLFWYVNAKIPSHGFN